MKLPKVLILYTGGTIGMDLKQNSRNGTEVLAIPNLSPQTLKERFQSRVPELQNIAHCDVDIILNRDSAHIGPDEWVLISRHIKKKWNRYDGIVILHGTDTLAYTASALSMLLRPCLKPIVMTGAQRPLIALRTDARMNLISAVEIASYGPKNLVSQVTVFFGDKLFQGNRVRKKSAADFAAFESPHFPPLAVEGTTIRYMESGIKKLPSQSKKTALLKSRFSKRVMVANVTPGFPAESMTESLLSHLDGLILVVFLSGTAPTHEKAFLDFLKRAQKLKLPIVVVTEGSSQPPSSINPQINYAAGNELLVHGCFWAGAMTPECAFVKTSLILGQTRNLEKFSKLWAQNLANEGYL